MEKERKSIEEVLKELKENAGDNSFSSAKLRKKHFQDIALWRLSQVESLKNKSRIILDKLVDEGDGPASTLSGFTFLIPGSAGRDCYEEDVYFEPDSGFDYGLQSDFKRDFAIFIREWFLIKTAEYEEMAKESVKQLSNLWN